MARLWPVTSSFTLFLLLLHLALAARESTLTLTIDTAGVKAERYYCAFVRVPDSTRYITKFEPHFNAAYEHHVLVFGCNEHRPDNRWLCPHSGAICTNGAPKLLYAWAKQAEGLALPQDVGFQVGRAVNVRSIVMQVHIKVPPSPQEPPPSLTFTLTTIPQTYAAGIFLVASNVYSIAPNKNQVRLKSACFYQGPTMHPFAFRTHAHSHGLVISGYVVKDGKWSMIGQRSPQDPQAFYPANKGLTVHTGDMLAAACTFDTSKENHEITFGPTSKDEMCNFYIMYYYKADSSFKLPSDSGCWQSAPASLHFPSSAFYLPNSSGTEAQPTAGTGANTTTAVPTNTETQPTTQTDTNSTEAQPTTGTGAHTTTEVPTETQPTAGTETHTIAVSTDAETQPTTQTNTATTHSPPSPAPISMSAIFAPAEDWPSTSTSGTGASMLGGVKLGQVSGVAVDTEGNVFVLHRASRVWDASSFSMDNHFRFRSDGPIADPVVLKVSPKGSLLRTWGRRIFYMPHGLTIDSRNNLWITDTARHQVMRAPAFNKNENKDPPLVLGNAFTPGRRRNQFCKPAAVAVDEQNDIFYVADGYCNSRIMVFKFDGTYVTQYSAPVDGMIMQIPHSLALSQGGDHLFVADRLNNRILRFDTKTKEAEVFCRVEGSMFAVSLARTRDGQKTWPLYAVNGSLLLGQKAVGYSINSTGNIVATWSPPKGFTKPHDLSASSDSSVYVAEIGPNVVWKMIPVPAGKNAVLPDVPDTMPTHEGTSPPSHSSSDTTPAHEGTSSDVTLAHEGTSPPSHSTPSKPPPPPSEEDDIDTYVCPTPPPPPSLGLKCTTRTISSSSLPSSSDSTTRYTSSVHPLLLTTTISTTSDSSSSSAISVSSCQSSCVVYVTNTAASSRLGASPLQVIFVSSMVIPVLLALSIFIGCYVYHRRCRARKEVPQRATRIALDTILGPARKGFHPVRNYDSDSGEEEDMFIFSKS